MRDEWSLWAWHHRGRLVGAFLGLAAGWFIVRFGFLKFLFVVFITAVGWRIGAVLDGEDPPEIWERVRRLWMR